METGTGGGQSEEPPEKKQRVEKEAEGSKGDEMAGEEAEEEGQFPADMVKELKEVQAEVDRVEDEHARESEELEKRFLRKKEPLFKRRAQVVSRVQSFWKCALLGHDGLGSQIKDNDEPLLDSLEHLDVTQSQDDPQNSFTIQLTLSAANPVFDGTAVEVQVENTSDGTLLNSSHPPLKHPYSKEDSALLRWLTTSRQLPPEESPDFISSAIRDDIWRDPVRYYNEDEEDEDDEPGLGADEAEEEAEEDPAS